MQAFTVVMLLPDDCDTNQILEKMQEVALDLAFESGADEDYVSENATEIEDSVSVYLGDATPGNVARDLLKAG